MSNQDLQPYRAENNQGTEQPIPTVEEVAPKLPEGSPAKEASSQPASSEPAPEHPSARKLAGGFRSFDPTRYLQQYRSALERYRDNIHSRWLDYRSEILEDRIEREEQGTVDWRDRAAQFIGSLAPVAAFIGRNGAKRVFTALFIIVLLFGVFVCFGGYAIIQALAD